MAGTSCSICLDELKDPVSIPCGHIHCQKCLIDCIEAGEDAMRSTCPTCRSPFSLAVPDMRTIPNKYHVYIDKAIRRVYIPQDATYAATVKNLKADVAKYKKKADLLAQSKKRCEIDNNHITQIANDARQSNHRLERQLAELTDKYSLLKGKYHSIKAAYAKSEECNKSVHSHPASSSATSISAPPHVPLTVKRKSGQAFDEDGDQSDVELDIPTNKRLRLRAGDSFRHAMLPRNLVEPTQLDRAARIGSPTLLQRTAPTGPAGFRDDPRIMRSWFPSSSMRLTDLRQRSAGPPPDATRVAARPQYIIADDEDDDDDDYEDDDYVAPPPPSTSSATALSKVNKTRSSLRTSSSRAANAARVAASKRLPYWPPPVADAPVASGSRPRADEMGSPLRDAKRAPKFDNDADWVDEDVFSGEYDPTVRGTARVPEHMLTAYVFRGHKFQMQD